MKLAPYNPETYNSKELAGYMAFKLGAILGDDNPCDPNKADYNYWETGWWRANREAFAEGVIAAHHFLNGIEPKECEHELDSPGADAHNDGFEWERRRYHAAL